MRSGPTTLTCSSIDGSLAAGSLPTSRSTSPDGSKSPPEPVASASPVPRSRRTPATPSGRTPWPSARSCIGSVEAGWPRSRSTLPEGMRSKSALASVVCIASGRASSNRSNIAEASPSDGTASAGVPGAAPGSTSRSSVDRSSSNDRSAGSSSASRASGAATGGARSRSLRLGRSGGKPIGSAMSETGSALAPATRLAAAWTSRSLRVPERWAAMSSTHSPR